MQGVLISHFNHSFLLQRYDMFIVVVFLRLVASTVLRASDAASDAAGSVVVAVEQRPSIRPKPACVVHS